MRQRVSLKDVAQQAGVSFQTASKVLNNKGTVAPATRLRIQEAARELGYVPNALARGLVNRSTSLVGVVASDISQIVLAQPLVGVEREARRLGFNVLIGSVSRSGDNSETVIRTLLERQVDGIIVLAPVLEHQHITSLMMSRQIPLVTTHEVLDTEVPRVLVDEEHIGLIATRHLLSLGHTDIATLVGDYRRRVSRVRLDGYRQAHQEAGMDVDEALIVEARWDIEAAYQATHHLLDQPRRPTAIFAQNDTMAIGVLAALDDRGIKTPRDCSVIGVDNIPVSARTIPPLTTFDIPFEQMGETAMRQLVDLIRGETPVDHHIILPAPMIYRASTGPRGKDGPERPEDHRIDNTANEPEKGER